MKRYVQVRVLGKDGRPEKDARVSFQIHQFLAGGFTPDQRTDGEGLATFELDTDAGAEVTLYVNGQDRTRRGAIEGRYQVYL